jgi:hypothetical protein
MDPISIAGIVISLAIAYWQFRKAKAAERELQKTLDCLPDKIVDNLKTITENSSSLEDTTIDNSRLLDERTFISYEDVNNDGNKELLVEHGWGPHSMVLKIYGWKRHEFKQIAELHSGTAGGFEIKDINNDGELEILAWDEAPIEGTHYINCLRVQTIYKWTGKKFDNIGEIKAYTDADVKRALKENKKDERNFL